MREVAALETQCNPEQLEFPGVGRCRIAGQFNGGALSSDAGALLLRDARGSSRYKKVIVRGDPGFCRESMMSWCEENAVDYVLGVAR